MTDKVAQFIYVSLLTDGCLGDNFLYRSCHVIYNLQGYSGNFMPSAMVQHYPAPWLAQFDQCFTVANIWIFGAENVSRRHVDD
jgi:hypothetical protein